MKPVDTVTSTIKAMDARGSTGFSAMRMQRSKLMIKSLGESGYLSASPCSEAGRKRNGQMHFGPLSLDPKPLIAIRWKSQNGDVVCAEAAAELSNVMQINVEGLWE